jgi:hypothetical protein
MTVISVVIGRIFNSVPASIQSSAPIGEYLAVAMLVYFGLRSLKDAWNMGKAEAEKNAAAEEDSDELTGAAELV